MDKIEKVSWTKLLWEAVNKPGTISEAYSRFWDFSLGNQLLAMIQIRARGIPMGPIASYRKWQDLGRQVRRGEKGISLLRPFAGKRKGKEGEEDQHFRGFVLRPQWFALSQTDGPDGYHPAPPPSWDRARALVALDVKEVEFQYVTGNVQGYARGREVAINPLADNPLKTLFHEIAHVALGHTTGTTEYADSPTTARTLQEAEAECVALICCEALCLPGADHARGYVQMWWGTSPIPPKSCASIMRVAGAILRAGRPGGVDSEA